MATCVYCGGELAASPTTCEACLAAGKPEVKAFAVGTEATVVRYDEETITLHVDVVTVDGTPAIFETTVSRAQLQLLHNLDEVENLRDLDELQ